MINGVRDTDLRSFETVFRLEYPGLVASLTRYTGDLGLAEELAQDAWVAALEQWPVEGAPRNARGWLLTVAKRRAVDHFRRSERLRTRYAELGRELDEAVTPDFDEGLVDTIDDDLLRLVFIACHPVLAPAAQVALTLRLLGGLTTTEIARAFLVPEPTIAQRIVRAKKSLAAADVPFEVPAADERSARLSSVLGVVYLIFNEGYSATAGADWMRPALCADALRLGRLLAALVPDEAEVHGLLSLMEIQASRTAARLSPDGVPVLLLDQDRRRWDPLLITRGLAALQHAEDLGGQHGPYALQAAIAACHARATRAEDTDWRRIADLYGVLAEVTPSPVVELNRAVAVSMADGPQAGLDVLDPLLAERSMQGYHLLPSVRGDLLMRLGRAADARHEFERAASLTKNVREQELSRLRADEAAEAAEAARAADALQRGEAAQAGEADPAACSADQSSA